MKIALIGDFSGVHDALKTGFEVLGHEVDVYSDGDGFKNIQSDKVLNPRYTRNLDKVRHYLVELPSLLDRIGSTYDAIQIVNPHVITGIRNSPAYYKYLMSLLRRSQGYKSLAVLGCEKNTQRVLSSLSRSPCPGCHRDHALRVCPFIDVRSSKNTDHTVAFADVVIPFGAPMYAAAYAHTAKVGVLLPFPVNTDLVRASGNKIENKIRILHGISRPGFKGSDVIMNALARIERSFPETFEIVRVQRLPFNEYLQMLSTVNVVVDQLYGDGLGMNALLSLAAGCVVFSSFERANTGELNLIDAPAIQIGASVDEIFLQLAALRFWTAADFASVGAVSREFVVNNCSPERVASRVIDIWKGSKSSSGGKYSRIVA